MTTPATTERPVAPTRRPLAPSGETRVERCPLCQGRLLERVRGLWCPRCKGWLDGDRLWQGDPS